MNIFFQLLNIIYAVLSFFRRKVFLLNIKPDDLVLDIGSGDKPFWRADVFVDLYTEDDQQRFSGEMVYDKRKIFINANVEKLPFADKSFDFVFCSHLLEHVEHPDRAIAEITR
ncbi:MAG: Methyltransferase type 11, partial [uncultured bacterium]